MSLLTDPATAPSFELERPWQINPQVALRDESFGALAYHYGTRRLHFLKSRTLVELVESLGQHENAAAALEATVPATERARYAKALQRLAETGVIDAC